MLEKKRWWNIMKPDFDFTDIGVNLLIHLFFFFFTQQ